MKPGERNEINGWDALLPPETVGIIHHPGCRADYPEKPEGEARREIQEVELEDGYRARVCKDCGAQVSNLPPLEDLYWDDVREEIER